MENFSVSEIDVDGIMAGIRVEVAKRKQAIEQHQETFVQNNPPAAPSLPTTLAAAPSPISSLGYLNGTAAYAERILANAAARAQLREHLPGKFQRFPLSLLAPLERLILKFFNALFKDQREVSSNLIQAIRELVKIDRALVGQSDHTAALGQAHSALQVQVESLTAQVNDLTAQLSNQMHSGREELAHFGNELGQTDEHVKIVDGRLQRLEQDSVQGLSPEQQQRWEQFYLNFENSFRGDREAIKQRLATAYSEIIRPFRESSIETGNKHQVLDIGSGRGEWLEYLKEAGLPAYGIDINQTMAQDCERLGLEVLEADGLTHLASLEAHSLSVISAFHVAEHLPIHRLLALVAEAQRVLKPNGLAIFETPNPENLSVGACNFYLDPTHLNPLPPPLLQFIFQQAGFERVEILRLHPMSADEHAIYHPYLKTMFFGHQDYAILAWKTNTGVAGGSGIES